MILKTEHQTFTAKNEKDNNLLTKLFELQDLEYKNFNKNLIPNIEESRIIGIRTPVLRKFAKDYAKTGKAAIFIKQLPHTYYEENNLHMMIITQIKDYEMCLSEVERFLPYIDNWATCDMPLPKCFKKNIDKLENVVKKWIKSGDTYTVRYGIGVLMRLYLDDSFKPEYLEIVAKTESEEYYVNMMIAWYFATALAKQWNEAIIWIEERRLSEWVHRKTIQKAIESYRITDEQKEYLRRLR